MSDDSAFEASMSALSRFFVGDGTVEETLLRVSELTVKAIPASDFVGLTLVVQGRPRTAVFTDPESPEVDQAQYDERNGPCLEAMETNRVVVIERMPDDDRYPAFRTAALNHGILSTLSLPLAAGERAVGAMNLYAKELAAFGEQARADAGVFASHASVVLANAQAYWDAQDLAVNLHLAMESRAVIEQAKGILMSAQHCGPDEAFGLLVTASQRENVKLRDIALRIVTRTSAPDPSP